MSHPTIYYPSVVLDSSGNPMISYYRGSDLVFSRCTDPLCATGSTQTLDGATTDVGWYTSLVLTSSGNPVISYFDITNSALKIAVCDDPSCSVFTLTMIDNSGSTGALGSLELNASGNPVISYHSFTEAALKLVVCGNLTCTSGNTITTVDNAGNVGWFTSLELNASGNPVIAYYDITNTSLKIAVCGNSNCTSGNVFTTLDNTGSVGGFLYMDLNNSGFPVVSYWDADNSDLKVAVCDTTTCGLAAVQFNPNTPITLNETAGTINIPVELVVGGGMLMSPLSATIQYTGTAANGQDFTGATTVTFTNAGGFPPGTYMQNLVLNVINDTIDELDETITLTITNAPVGVNGTRQIAIVDNDTSAVLVTPAITIVEGGGSGDYAVTLGSQPLADVTLLITPQAECNVSPASLTFTSSNYAVAQFVTVNAINDVLAEGLHPCIITHLASSGDVTYNGIAVPQVVASIIDDDVPGMTIGGSTTATEGSSMGSYTLLLNTQPTAPVTITLTPNAQCTLSPAFLTFDPSNWNAAQNVVVTATVDQVVEGVHTCLITHTLTSADISYDGLVTPFNFIILENDTQQPQIGVFDPAISKIGFLLPGQLGVTGERVEWVVTVSNLSAIAGNQVVVTDTLRPELRIDNVSAPGGSVSVTGQTVTVTYGVLSPNQTVQFSIFTTVINGAALDNTACVESATSSAECVTASVVARLPQTGQTPAWRIALMVGVGLIALAAMIVIAFKGVKSVRGQRQSWR